MAKDDLAIKIPDSHYIGFQKRGDDELPLAFMTPDGTDSQAKKRKTTVDSWAKNVWGQSQPLPAQSLKNELISGFSLVRSIKRCGWNGGNVVWRITDPRGFELEISSQNLSQILLYSNINKGEITDKCIWGRLGADNVLIPEGSDVYQNAVTNTDRTARKVSKKDLKRGMTVLLQNGIIGIYLGSYYTIEKYHSFCIVHNDSAPTSDDTIKVSSSKKDFILVWHKNEGSYNYKYVQPSFDNKECQIMVTTSIKVSDIVANVEEELSIEFCEGFINKYHSRPINGNGGDIREFVGAVFNTFNPLNDISWEEKEYDITPYITNPTKQVEYSSPEWNQQLFIRHIDGKISVYSIRDLQCRQSSYSNYQDYCNKYGSFGTGWNDYTKIDMDYYFINSELYESRNVMNFVRYLSMKKSERVVYNIQKTGSLYDILSQTCKFYQLHFSFKLANGDIISSIY